MQYEVPCSRWTTNWSPKWEDILHLLIFHFVFTICNIQWLQRLLCRPENTMIIKKLHENMGEEKNSAGKFSEAEFAN